MSYRETDIRIGDELVCAWCGDTFTTASTQEEAAAEFEANAEAGLWPLSDAVDVICDDCYAAEFGDGAA